MDAMSEWPVVGIVERDGNTSHPNAALALLPNQGNMQEPAPEVDIKPTVLPRMASLLTMSPSPAIFATRWPWPETFLG